MEQRKIFRNRKTKEQTKRLICRVLIYRSIKHKKPFRINSKSDHIKIFKTQINKDEFKTSDRNRHKVTDLTNLLTQIDRRRHCLPSPCLIWVRFTIFCLTTNIRSEIGSLAKPKIIPGNRRQYGTRPRRLHGSRSSELLWRLTHIFVPLLDVLLILCKIIIGDPHWYTCRIQWPKIVFRDFRRPQYDSAASLGIMLRMGRRVLFAVIPHCMDSAFIVRKF